MNIYIEVKLHSSEYLFCRMSSDTGSGVYILQMEYKPFSWAEETETSHAFAWNIKRTDTNSVPAHFDGNTGIDG